MTTTTAAVHSRKLAKNLGPSAYSRLKHLMPHAAEEMDKDESLLASFSRALLAFDKDFFEVAHFSTESEAYILQREEEEEDVLICVLAARPSGGRPYAPALPRARARRSLPITAVPGHEHAAPNLPLQGHAAHLLDLPVAGQRPDGHACVAEGARRHPGA